MIIPDTQSIIGSPSVGYTRLDRIAGYSLPTGDARATIVSACVSIGALANIGDMFLYCWAAKETGNFSSARWLKSFNPAGLGATNDGAWGGVFASPAAGFAAMAGHAIGYALPAAQMSKPQTALALLDPRREALKQAHGFGSAPRFADLSQRWGVLPEGTPVPPLFDPSAYGMSIIVRVRKALDMP